MRNVINPGIWLITLAFLLAIGFSTTAAAKTIYVDNDGPADFNNIQSAIDDSNNGDVIIVAPGEYIINEPITYRGKNITLKSDAGPKETIVQGRFVFNSGETNEAVLEGFTITKGGAFLGGGIYCEGSSPIIRYNIITENGARAGGGIYCRGSNIEISGNIIMGNTADPDYSGGIYCRGNHIIIRDNIIKYNYAGEGGAMGIYASGSDILIEGNIVSENYACGGGEGILIEGSNSIIKNNVIAWNDDAHGIECTDSSNILFNNNTVVGNSWSGVRNLRSDITVKNCIIWNNSTHGYQFRDVDGVDPSKVSYCLLSLNPELCGQNGNISKDPRFADPNNGDYHLKSQAGRWNPNSQSWVKDDVTSPCIDAGDPRSPIGLEPFPNGGIINMGAYGGTREASKSYFGEPVCETIMAGDINGDCIVDFKDFAIMAYHWLEEK